MAILLDTSFDADRADAEGFDDLELLACPLADELGGEHAKGIAIGLGMSEDRPCTVEPGVLFVFLNDADKIIDGSSPIGEER